MAGRTAAARYGVLSLVAALILTGCDLFFDYDAYDYELDSLELGVAFPPAQDAGQLTATIAACRELGFTRVRIQESWASREPQKDSYNWGPLDTRIGMLHDAGIRILLTLGAHEWPGWLAPSATHGEPETLGRFRHYAADLLARYDGRIDRIQFGNEWNWEIDDYFGCSESAYVAYANVLYEEVMKRPAASRPTAVLGSLNGLAYLALDQGLIDSIVILGREPYADEIAAYLASPDRALSKRAAYVLRNANYEMLDIHLYDDAENWPAYLQALNAAASAAKGATFPVLVSEFGGPYPVSEYGFYGGRPRRSVLAGCLPDYLHALDSMDVQEAYFFSLKEDPARYHRDSFLVDLWGFPTFAFEVLRRFHKANTGA